jgi:AAHS family 4-hydroxybenzoate transporter-like MFS transporter
MQVDVGRVLDEGRWGGYQKLVVFMAALVIIIDGVDNQLLGVAIPAIMQDWAVPRSALAPILALGFVGMMVGGALAGVIGDRFGRRFALISSVVVFGFATISAAMAPNLIFLGIMRFIAGVGLQGAVPTAAALVSEYAPLRRRAFAVTLTIVFFPLGATAAGVIAIPVLPVLGWRAFFVVGGALAIAVALFLLRALPESPRYLARHSNRWAELATILRRLGHDVPREPVFFDRTEKSIDRVSLKALLTPDIRFDSFALWAAFFFCLLAVYSGGNWVPSILAGAGLNLTIANTGITAFNLGGVVGAICGALAVGRFGSRRTMITMAAGAIASALVMTQMNITAQSAPLPIILMLGVTGGLINAVQTTMYALATHIYPSAMRATGVGTASSVGRVGAIVSPFIGNWALEAGGSSFFFGLLAAAMTMVVASLGAIRRHVPAVLRSTAVRAATVG